jgi:hypothetical protein
MIPPEENLFISPSGDRDRMPVSKEHFEIENELFLEIGDSEVISKRTGKTIPQYLTRQYYALKNKFSPYIDMVANQKGDRVCRRQYPRNVHRNMGDLHTEAEGFFRIWWVHLDDEEDAPKVDEEAVKQAYVKAFTEVYIARLYNLDREHPENLEEHHRLVDNHAAYVRQSGRGRTPATQYNKSDYYRTSQQWKQNIARDGRQGGQNAAGEDHDIGVGFREGKDLEDLAQKRFLTVWKDLTLGVYFDDQTMFDFLGLRNIYVQNFIRVYLERANSSEGPPQAGQTGTRIVTTKLDRDVRVYVIEITDPEHLSAPIQVEVAVSNEDDIEIREATDDAG